MQGTERMLCKFLTLFPGATHAPSVSPGHRLMLVFRLQEEAWGRQAGQGSHSLPPGRPWATGGG